MARPDAALIESLRARIWALERPVAGGAEPPLGLAPALDAALPWGGLPLACLHQVVADDKAAATGWCAVVMGRLAARGPVLWIPAEGDLYLPGLAAFGLAPGRVVVVRAAGPVEALWAMEEGLRCPALGGVVGEVAGLDLTAGRRLQLAAEAGGVTGLILGPPDGRPPTGTATTRWRVAAAPSPAPPWQGLGPPRWRVTLERCRQGRPRSFTVEWRDETRTLAVVE